MSDFKTLILDCITQVMQNVQMNEKITDEDIKCVFRPVELCGTAASPLLERTVEQFQRWNCIRSDTVLMPCTVAAHQHTQPCSCRFITHKNLQIFEQPLHQLGEEFDDYIATFLTNRRR